MKSQRYWMLAPLAAILTASGLVAGQAAAKADEWEESTPYYEDDAWYDVSEWFDGNDYNPTDEVIGRWDDQTYETWQDTGGDEDNDWGIYAGGDINDDWFYDYYDYDYDYDSSLDEDVTDTTDVYRFADRYYDYDDDDLYDAYAAFYDWDGDGTYEDVDLFWFNDSGQQKQDKKNAEKEAKTTAPSSKAYRLTGTIEKSKSVDTRSGKHTVVLVKQKKSGKQIAVDLGRQDQLNEVNLDSGAEIQVGGPMAKIGDKSILMAQTLKAGGEEVAIDRNPKSRKGEVVETRKVDVRGKKHLLAVIQSTKNKDQKLAVDLGAVDQLKADIKKGDQLSVSGFPVKSRDKTVLMAQSVTRDGKTFDIARRKTDKMAETASRQKSKQEETR